MFLQLVQGGENKFGNCQLIEAFKTDAGKDQLGNEYS